MPDPTQKTVTFAVVGCGHIGKRHLAVIEETPRAELVAFCDTDPATLAIYTARYPHARAYADYHLMLREHAVDIVCICTPHALHSSMSIYAASQGVNVLVEKPMALTTLESERMIEATRHYGVKLFVVKQNRYNHPIVAVRDALRRGDLGKVYLAQCNVIWNRHDAYYAQSPWRGSRLHEGGALHTQVSHFLDLLVWWFGDVEQARTIMDTLGHDIQIEDVGVSALRFSSGVIGSLTWTTCAYRQNYEGSMLIVAQKGTVKVGGRYLNQIEFWDVEGVDAPPPPTAADAANDYGTYRGSSNNHDKLLEDLVERFLINRAGIVEGDEGIRSIRAIEKIYGAA